MIFYIYFYKINLYKIIYNIYIIRYIYMFIERKGNEREQFGASHRAGENCGHMIYPWACRCDAAFLKQGSQNHFQEVYKVKTIFTTMLRCRLLSHNSTTQIRCSFLILQCHSPLSSSLSLGTFSKLSIPTMCLHRLLKNPSQIFIGNNSIFFLW